MFRILGAAALASIAAACDCSAGACADSSQYYDNAPIHAPAHSFPQSFHAKHPGTETCCGFDQHGLMSCDGSCGGACPKCARGIAIDKSGCCSGRHCIRGKQGRCGTKKA